ncbi:MAG: rhodanese-like domain-containing protein [Oscillospiraceae bacterium]|nr:rhodanese-like domain-containing protein [Oscillospiraceae bacterium]MBQ9981442.1 rhodanese-like domain-containing protein [Oscillospiraceae bacterium]
MIVQSLKAECKYYVAELKSTSKGQKYIFLMYVGLLIYCYTQRRPLSESSVAEGLLLSSLSSTYLVIRMMITGFTLPFNVINNEIEHRGLIQKRNMYSYPIMISLTSRILIKFAVSVLINALSFTLLLFSLNYVVNIENHLVVFLLLIVGTMFMLSLGFIISLIMNRLDLKREFIVFFEVVFLLIHFGYKGYNLFLPISVISSHVESIISTDILYTKFLCSEEVALIPYFLVIIAISVLLIVGVSVCYEYYFPILLYKKENVVVEKNNVKSYVYFTFLVVAIIFFYLNYSAKSYHIIIETSEVQKLSNSRNPAQVLVDLRDQKDYEEGHIPGFINIPSKEGKELLEYLQSHKLKKKYIYLMCYSGNRSANAFNVLYENGYPHVTYVKFGYDDFVEEQEEFTPQIGKCPCLAED